MRAARERVFVYLYERKRDMIRLRGTDTRYSYVTLECTQKYLFHQTLREQLSPLD